MNQSQQKQVQDVKNIMNSYFESKEIQDKIRKKVQQENIQLEDLSNEKLLQILEDTTLMDEIMQDLNKVELINKYNQNINIQQPMNQSVQRLQQTQQIGLQQQQQQFQSGRVQVVTNLSDKVKQRAISLQIIQGKAFVDYIADNKQNREFQLYVNFLNKRYCSNKFPVSVEPIFNANFFFELKSMGMKSDIDLLTLVKLEQQIELVLALVSPDGTKEIFAIKQLEWRFLLTFGSINMNVELAAYDAYSKIMTSSNTKSKVSVGILQIQMDLLPKGEIELIPERILNDQLNKEKKFRDIDILRFYNYSTEWWTDFKQIRPTFEQRACKIYSENEDGLFLPVFCYLTPLTNVRGIDSPFHAARFVSLIPHQRKEKPGGERLEIWPRFHTFISAGCGDVEAHATLLCSLLLGFGMDSYIVLGTSSEGPHMWVMTRQESQGKVKIIFWESLNGQRYEQKDPRVNTLYRNIGCVFNNQSYYANIQEVERAFHVNLANLDDRIAWKPMDPDQIKCLSNLQTQIQLIPSSINAFSLEEEIEIQIKQSISNHRKDYGLLTKFDDQLAYYLVASLTNYEHERTLNQTFGQEEFQNVIKKCIPEKHTFKAFPIQFKHQNTQQMITTLKQSNTYLEIMNTRGDSINFAVRCKIFAYPDDIIAVWLSVAVRFYDL